MSFSTNVIVWFLLSSWRENVLFVDTANQRSKFFLSVDGVLRWSDLMSGIVKVYLHEKPRLPIITYGSESLSLSSSQFCGISSWWNSFDRETFKYEKLELVSKLFSCYNVWILVPNIFLDKLNLLVTFFMRLAQFYESSAYLMLSLMCA